MTKAIRNTSKNKNLVNSVNLVNFYRGILGEICFAREKRITNYFENPFSSSQCSQCSHAGNIYEFIHNKPLFLVNFVNIDEYA